MATHILLSEHNPITGERPFCTAKSRFASARQRARRGQFLSNLTGRSRALYALNEVRAACAVEDQSDGGTRPVPINQIRGSESRSRYFDRDFNPLHDRARGRWLGIARAREQGKYLPPVVLVRVGDIYFVRDGHHRISVARAFGQLDIEARVTVWQVTGSLPWEVVTDEPGTEPVCRFLDAWRALKERGSIGLLGSLRGLWAQSPAPGK